MRPLDGVSHPGKEKKQKKIGFWSHFCSLSFPFCCFSHKNNNKGQISLNKNELFLARINCMKISYIIIIFFLMIPFFIGIFLVFFFCCFLFVGASPNRVVRIPESTPHSTPQKTLSSPLKKKLSPN